ncbi:leucine carboxyl methyl transferase [Acanthamoeba castellanii str. Neff]|uniref:Leucine carboxyl methyltransferase 1 n=1 Tax=Acanthamoeba castellanii (strain ATCC 30010 / Neff) TaxID=1257118 RepID=L8GJS4_ACACF|nr:leucine carboxyl methyl transferase [Acanthamoeba castellanii str. Neff]ELR13277.1 leucine carboxyl methyl transferase [Acanthamoeba castellanii str. Neff]
MEKPALTFSFAAPKRTTQRRQPPAGHDGSGADPRSPAAKAMAEDIAVMLTNDDAAVSKLSAVRLGYWRDNFLHHFVRGYYTRVAAIHNVLRQFLAAGGSDTPKQVVCLGAGFDTTYFQKKSEGWLGDNVVFYELDFGEVVKRKSNIITTCRELHELIAHNEAGIRVTEEGLHTKNYHLITADLRSIEHVDKVLTTAGLDKRWAATYEKAVFVTYEQILPDDAFGRMMLKNLEERNVHLHGLHARPSIETQRSAYLALGWDEAQVVDMNAISDRLLGRDELARIEMFDEVEEWRLTQAHYCIVLATTDASKSGIWADLSLIQPTPPAVPTQQ